jgi:hypothetical protein
MITPSACGSTQEACSSLFDEMMPSEIPASPPMTDMGRESPGKDYLNKALVPRK